MNGDRTAEQYAQIASEAALRASQKAQTATNASMEAKQAVSLIEREVGELRTEMNDGFTEVTKLIRQQSPYRGNAKATTLTHEDFEETPTGSFKVSRDTYSTKVLSDARKWRKLWARVRWAVWLILGAVGIKLAELGVERLLRHF